MRLTHYTCAVIMGVLLTAYTAVNAAAPSNEELYRIIQQQNKRIDSLEKELIKARTGDQGQRTQALKE